MIERGLWEGYCRFNLVDDFKFLKVIHKAKHFRSLSADLYKVVHKRRYFQSLRDKLAPIVWHPDRVIDWCFDDEEKRDLKRIWGEL